MQAPSLPVNLPQKHNALLYRKFSVNQRIQPVMQSIHIDGRQKTNRSHIDANHRNIQSGKISYCLDKCSVPADHDNTVHIFLKFAHIRVSGLQQVRSHHRFRQMAHTVSALHISFNFFCNPQVSVFILICHN